MPTQYKLVTLSCVCPFTLSSPYSLIIATIHKDIMFTTVPVQITVENNGSVFGQSVNHKLWKRARAGKRKAAVNKQQQQQQQHRKKYLWYKCRTTGFLSFFSFIAFIIAIFFYSYYNDDHDNINNNSSSSISSNNNNNNNNYYYCYNHYYIFSESKAQWLQFLYPFTPPCSSIFSMWPMSYVKVTFVAATVG